MHTSPLLRVKSIHIDGLFDLFDHRVELKLNKRVTILHGPNGVGKTMLLRMIDALLDGRYSLFQQVPFRRFALEFTDETCVELTMGAGKRGRGRRQTPMLHLKLFGDGKKLKEHDLSSNQDIISMADAVASRLPWVHRLDDEVWSDERGMGNLSAEEIVSLYRDELPSQLCPERGAADPSWLADLRRRVSVHLIEAQRLLRLTFDDTRRYHPGPRSVLTVLDYARDLSPSLSSTSTISNKNNIL